MKKVIVLLCLLGLAVAPLAADQNKAQTKAQKAAKAEVLKAMQKNNKYNYKAEAKNLDKKTQVYTAKTDSAARFDNRLELAIKGQIYDAHRIFDAKIDYAANEAVKFNRHIDVEVEYSTDGELIKQLKDVKTKYLDFLTEISTIPTEDVKQDAVYTKVRNALKNLRTSINMVKDENEKKKMKPFLYHEYYFPAYKDFRYVQLEEVVKVVQSKDEEGTPITEGWEEFYLNKEASK